VLKQIDFSRFRQNPKWLTGFSDVTVLHTVLNKFGIASIHGAMPGFFIDNKKPSASFFSLTDLLRSGKSKIQVPGHELNRKGICKGELVGGNLSLICNLQGTQWQLETNGKILLIEDLSEYLYHLDRMMQNLKLSGTLENLAGLVVGGFTDMKDNESPFGMNAYEVIYDAVKDYTYPVCFDVPIGHIPKNLSVMLGGNYRLEVGEPSVLNLI
jgi:muramoyltetrapeptide carboxypeptidase